MIRNFRSRALQRFMERGDPRRIHPEHREIVRDILVRLNASATPYDMDLPGVPAASARRRICRVPGGDGPRQLAGHLPV